MSGAIFVFFKHAFDVGDRVDLFNLAEGLSVPVIVKRISLLYVVFERVDDGKDVQFPNIRLTDKRIENLSRSGLNREQIALHIDFNTSFRDIQALRGELEAFLRHRDNARDYRPELGLHVASIHDMDKLELTVRVAHKSNWADEDLRAARSSRFLCTLIAALKRVPINRPGGAGAKTGDEGRPAYSVVITEEEAMKKRDAEKLKMKKKRMDYVEEEEDSGADKAVDAGPGTKDASALNAGAPLTAEDVEAERKKAEEKLERECKEAEEKQQEEDARNQFSEIPAVVEQRGRTGSTAVSLAVGVASRSPYSFVGRDGVGLRRSPRSIGSGAGESRWGFGDRK